MATRCASAAVLCLVLSGTVAFGRTTAVYVKTDPTGADITVDGRMRGKTPRLVTVRAGPLTLTLTLDGHEEVTREIEVTEGALQRLNVRLHPLAGRAREGDLPALTVRPPEGGDLAGKILLERWDDVTTKGPPNPQDPAACYHRAPDITEYRSSFLAPENVADQFVSRMSGYVHPPQTGEYVFFIASDDGAELWLSTDETPANARRVARVFGYTLVDQYDKETNQRSAPITLAAGRRYYIEALHSEGSKEDCLAVGWLMPDGSLERPIPGSRLSASKPTARGDRPSYEAVPGCGLLATYFADVSMNREAGRRLETTVSFGWDDASPWPGRVPADAFAMRLEGSIAAPATGNYTFVASIDDGARLFVDGRLVVDDWNDGAERRIQSRPVRLEKGVKTPIRLEYYDNIRLAVIRLSWITPGDVRMTPIPNGCLSPPEGWKDE